jgi:hypothetical protein
MARNTAMRETLGQFRAPHTHGSSLRNVRDWSRTNKELQSPTLDLVEVERDGCLWLEWSCAEVPDGVRQSLSVWGAKLAYRFAHCCKNSYSKKTPKWATMDAGHMTAKFISIGRQKIITHRRSQPF